MSREDNRWSAGCGYIQYIHEIAARKDVIVFDLDVMAYEDVKKYILKAMGG